MDHLWFVRLQYGLGMYRVLEKSWKFFITLKAMGQITAKDYDKSAPYLEFDIERGDPFSEFSFFAVFIFIKNTCQRFYLDFVVRVRWGVGVGSVSGGTYPPPAGYLPLRPYPPPTSELLPENFRPQRNHKNYQKS